MARAPRRADYSRPRGAGPEAALSRPRSRNRSEGGFVLGKESEYRRIAARGAGDSYLGVSRRLDEYPDAPAICRGPASRGGAVESGGRPLRIRERLSVVERQQVCTGVRGLRPARPATVCTSRPLCWADRGAGSEDRSFTQNPGG